MSHPNQAVDVMDGTEDRASGWRETLDRVVPAVVVLRVVSTRPFDTEVAGSSHATGFVVDRARGLILTNRHVRTTEKLVCVWHHSRARTCLLDGLSLRYACVRHRGWRAGRCEWVAL